MVNERSKENLKPFTSDTARTAQLKGAKTRSRNATALQIIDQNLEALVKLVDTPMTEEEFKEAVAKLPTPFLRIYGKDLDDPVKARLVLEKLIDRIKGLPKQSADVNVVGDVKYSFKFGD